MSLSKAVVGFVNNNLAEGLTDRSVNSYERLLNKWIEYEGDKDVGSITSQNIRRYLAWLRTAMNRAVSMGKPTHSPRKQFEISG